MHYTITCLVTRNTLLALVVLIFPIVVLVYPLAIFVCPLVVFVCPLVVPVCPLVVSVCPLVVLVVLSVGHFITDLKQVELWVQFLKTCTWRSQKKHLPFFVKILFLVSIFVTVLQCCGLCFWWQKTQLNFDSPYSVYKHVPDAVLNSNSSLSVALVKLNFSRTANSFLKDSKINLISQRSWPNCRVILSFMIFR